MSDYKRLLDTFTEIGVEFHIEGVDDFCIGWYKYPAEWLGFWAINAGGGQFVFDSTGRFLAVGIGDDQTSVDFRKE